MPQNNQNWTPTKKINFIAVSLKIKIFSLTISHLNAYTCYITMVGYKNNICIQDGWENLINYLFCSNSTKMSWNKLSAYVYNMSSKNIDIDITAIKSILKTSEMHVLHLNTKKNISHRTRFFRIRWWNMVRFFQTRPAM